MQVRKRIRDDVEAGAEKQQREYFLRKQMDSIRKELGEDEGSVVEEYRAKIDEAAMPDDVREQAERELARLERMGESAPESSMIRTYLDWLLAVPWGGAPRSGSTRRPRREVLDADHAGLDDVKERIVEYIAVRKLRQERGIEPDERSGAILTLIGPPGTGKTSIGESIARRRTASSSACRSAASATRPRSAATAAPTSARCRAGSCAPCATPGR